MKKTISLGMADLDIGSPPIQTPAVVDYSPAGPQAEPARRSGGRPRTAPEGDTTRVSCVLDAETYEAVAIYCVKRKINRQQFIAEAIQAKLGN